MDDINTLLVTGGAGFIGSHFINIFAQKHPNIPIICLDALYYCANLNNIHKSILESKYFTFIQGNLQHFDTVKDILQQNTITHIIHFAAQSHVQMSFEDS